jgi:hypothetical protein
MSLLRPIQPTNSLADQNWWDGPVMFADTVKYSVCKKWKFRRNKRKIKTMGSYFITPSICVSIFIFVYLYTMYKLYIFQKQEVLPHYLSAWAGELWEEFLRWY